MKVMMSKVFSIPIQMNLVFNNPSAGIPLKSSTLPCYQPKAVRTTVVSRMSGIPARDRVIDLGKYSGKMLGSLPSSYLKWVSKNLRAGDTEEWAKLADQVLVDPVYRDRIEWELAENVLSGNEAASSAIGDGRNAVSELLEISKRFGWDNEDKRGWSRIDFGLLGTSRGGRIPRVAAAAAGEETSERIEKKKKNKVEEEDGGRRRERRERVRRRMATSCGNGEEMSSDDQQEEKKEDAAVVVSGVGRRSSPFPGREALMKKVINRQKIV